LARSCGVVLTTLDDVDALDLGIDGADEIDPELNLVKGRGGSLFREKIVASVSDQMIVVVDETKLVDRLGRATPLPVEIARFGWQTVLDRLAAAGHAPRLRRAGDEPFVPDGGNYIADCAIDAIPDAAALEAQLSALVGVVETGLFIGLASRIVVGGRSGVEVIAR
jgi:ribose 5-phosphate isomerase A